jgi:hypothetical protein
VRSSGEFETCPDWVPTVDKRRRCARIDLKTMDVCGFDQRDNWPAKVRNVSSVRSQKPAGFVALRVEKQQPHHGFELVEAPSAPSASKPKPPG